MAARSTVLTEQQQAIDQQKSTLRLREAAILRQEEGILQQHAAVRRVPLISTRSQRSQTDIVALHSPCCCLQASQDASAAVQQAASIKAEYQQKLQELATRKESLDLLESELTARQRSHLVDVQSFTAKVEQHEQHWVSQMESLRQREAELQAQQAVREQIDAYSAVWFVVLQLMPCSWGSMLSGCARSVRAPCAT